MERKPFALGRVINGRISVLCMDGSGFSRPINQPQAPVVQISVNDEESTDTMAHEEPVDMMPWIKEWSDRKRVDYTPPSTRKGRKKPTLMARLVQYIKDEFI